MLTRFAEQIPAKLPDTVRHFAYAPFSQLLPRVAALVHHGGIGTAAQAMASATPQLIMPLAHDQFDNADRMKKLGIARSLIPKKFKGPAIASLLKGWITSPEVLANCRNVANRIAQDDQPMQRAAEAIEALIRQTSPTLQDPDSTGSKPA